MGKVTAIVNQKGGVGKTTTVINLGACFARTHLSEMKEEKSIKALDKHLDEMIESKRYSNVKEPISEANPQAHTVSVSA